MIRTTCNRDCPDACALLAEVDEGRVTALRGDPDHPVTRGFLCPRTRAFPARHHHPSRLLRPLLRRGDRQVEISFDDALDLAAERLSTVLRESGPAAVFPYRLGGSLGLLKEVTDHFFAHLGPHTVKAGDVCSAAGEQAQLADFGHLDTHDLRDLLHARHVLVWGRNASVTSVHSAALLQEARSRGTRVILVDPVHTATAALADRVLAPRPASDAALALAVARRLFETDRVRLRVGVDGLEPFRALCFERPLEDLLAACDLPLGDVDLLADTLADGPTALLVGWGLQRRQDGAATVRLLDALGALSGNLGRSGGGVWFTTVRRRPFRTDLFRPPIAARFVREPCFADDLSAATDPPVRFLWVTCANPIAMLPDARAVARAIEAVEFTVVVDAFPTDTTRRATLVLPTTTLLEDDDLLGSYGHHGVGVSRPVVPPPPGVCSDLEIVQALARRLGLEACVAGTARAWKTRLLAGRGLSLEDLERGHGEIPHPQVLFEEGVPTPSGRVRLIDHLPRREPVDPDRPLWLFSVSHPRSQASQWVEEPEGPLPATVHPDACPGIPDGAAAFLVGALGRLPVRIRHDARLRPDLVVVPKGGALDRDQAVNALIPQRTTDLGDGAACFDVRVGVEPRA